MAKSSTGAGRGRSRSPLPPGGSQSSGSVFGASFRFVKESGQELRKVQWPTWPQIMQGTMVVVFVTAIFAIYLTIVDFFVVKAVHGVDRWLT